jgi:2-polyprenyl-3-methyl-5-hydroxy-6-metoxy-1,4-benzoquinol methylase
MLPGGVSAPRNDNSILACFSFLLHIVQHEGKDGDADGITQNHGHGNYIDHLQSIAERGGQQLKGRYMAFWGLASYYIIVPGINCNCRKSMTSSRKHHVCPWWLCFTFDNVFRRFLQNPEHILKSYVNQGMKVLDIGAGMGYFTIPLADLVGDQGKVIAADIQAKMLDGIGRRAIRASLQDRIKLHQSQPDKIGINESIDFCLAFWITHEVPDRARFLAEISSNLRQNGLLLLVEPKIHITSKSYEGFSIADHPKIFLSYATLLKKE